MPAVPNTAVLRAAPGPRLAARVRDELATLALQLAEAREGQDRAVHQARKTLQRLRALVRLWAPLDPLRAGRENLALRRLRRRLGALRDAGARRETLRRIAARPRWAAHAAALRALAAQEEVHHREAWRRHALGGALWRTVERDLARLAARIAGWPCEAVNTTTADAALRRAGRRLQRRLRDAIGRHGHEVRHELRRKLRHYANLRQAVAALHGGEDAEAVALLELAKQCGVEGDLWMARSSALRAARETPALRELAAALQAERRRRCARHDEALRRLLRG